MRLHTRDVVEVRVCLRRIRSQRPRRDRALKGSQYFDARERFVIDDHRAYPFRQALRPRVAEARSKLLRRRRIRCASLSSRHRRTARVVERARSQRRSPDSASRAPPASLGPSFVTMSVSIPRCDDAPMPMRPPCGAFGDAVLDRVFDQMAARSDSVPSPHPVRSGRRCADRAVRRIAFSQCAGSRARTPSLRAGALLGDSWSSSMRRRKSLSAATVATAASFRPSRIRPEPALSVLKRKCGSI